MISAKDLAPSSGWNPPSPGKAEAVWDKSTIGAQVAGVITYIGTSVMHNDKAQRNQEVIRIDLEQPNGDHISIFPVKNTNVDDNGYPDGQATAIGTAILEACGEDGQLEVGGTLAMERIADRTTKNDFTMHQFKAGYKPPAPASTSIDDLLGAAG